MGYKITIISIIGLLIKPWFSLAVEWKYDISLIFYYFMLYS